MAVRLGAGRIVICSALHSIMTKEPTKEPSRKPLGIKNYGHIPHLPGSRMGPGDHTCHEGQARIATEKSRDRHDHIVVQEKLDGSNVGVCRLDGVIYALTRAGYIASTSPYEQHHRFEAWVYQNQERFLAVLGEGERLVGEWLALAHGTRYRLLHEPFVAFDLMSGIERMIYDLFIERVKMGEFVTPHLIHRGTPLSIEAALRVLNGDPAAQSRRTEFGFHGALEPVEGAVWRVERNELIHPSRGERKLGVDFLVKYVRPDKSDGKYLSDVSGQLDIWNTE